MSADETINQRFLGPHEGRELELMICGSKPLSMFVEWLPAELESFPEQDFDRLVTEKKLIKHVAMETTTGSVGEEVRFRRVLYALPAEAWRIQSMILIQHVYDSLSPGWRPDLDRVIGLLLGYDRADIERFVEQH